jgi:hypothetical protein
LQPAAHADFEIQQSGAHGAREDDALKRASPSVICSAAAARNLAAGGDAAGGRVLGSDAAACVDLY